MAVEEEIYPENLVSIMLKSKEKWDVASKYIKRSNKSKRRG